MNESLDQFYNQLTQRLSQPLLFYFSRRLWNLVGKEQWEDEQFEHVFDTVILVKPDGSNMFLNNEPSTFHIIFQKEQFDKNMFQLLDAQKRLDEKQFKYLLDKYYVHLNFFVKTSSLMVDNIQNDIKDISQETLQSFRLQHSAYREHWSSVQQNFKETSLSKPLTLDKTLNEKELKSFQNLIFPTGILPNIKNKASLVPFKRTKRKKKILVTEEEATAFLLKTVFNID